MTHRYLLVSSFSISALPIFRIMDLSIRFAQEANATYLVFVTLRVSLFWENHCSILSICLLAIGSYLSMFDPAFIDLIRTNLPVVYCARGRQNWSRVIHFDTPCCYVIHSMSR